MTRLEANREILTKLWNIVDKYPDFRFGQILFNYVLNYTQSNSGQIHIDDPFYEESRITLHRILCKINKLKTQY